ncbi:MAG: GTP cyclohydrolase I FolE [Bacteroidetes bacterium]|jgi:GTP cyclohydrolase I|nr:GTP cyclohydrolase I FolE [Bacteroidota bacterium]
MIEDVVTEKLLHELNEEHLSTSIDTPMREDAFKLNDTQKIKIIADHFKQIMHTLGLDLTDDSLKDTPLRVAKMYVKEAFSGLNPANKPQAALFENKYRYNEMLIEKDITLYSYCEHHFVPIIGKVHVAYIPNKKVIGLSKINRLVQYYAKRPQVQERLVNQIAEGLKAALNSDDVAVIIDATHLCVCSRGIKDTNSSTITAHYSGKFKDEKLKMEFITLIK